MRIGIGYDIHALKKGRKLILGGVEIPFFKGLDGHSDADVLLHAIMDALLGAAGEGDIGDHFSPADPVYKNINSARLVDEVVKLLRKKSLKIINVSAIIITEAPKLYSYKAAIRKNIARILSIPVAQVGLSAKTNEGFGALGANKAIASYAVANLRRAR